MGLGPEAKVSCEGVHVKSGERAVVCDKVGVWGLDWKVLESSCKVRFWGVRVGGWCGHDVCGDAWALRLGFYLGFRVEICHSLAFRKMAGGGGGGQL